MCRRSGRRSFLDMNIDRFLPVRAKRLRFTVLATNSLEPCIDELEVFNTAGKTSRSQVLAPRARPPATTTVADRHEARFINDGQYGNSRSWMSNEPGKGWVELEFATEQEIERVVWGRDREGKFEDRLATDYRIETATGEDWQLSRRFNRSPPLDRRGKSRSDFHDGWTDVRRRQRRRIVCWMKSAFWKPKSKPPRAARWRSQELFAAG